MAQPDGYYPRLNSELLGTGGQFDGMIVSLVGKVQSKNLADGTIQFQCCDGGIVVMDISQLADDAENLATGPDAAVVEAIGQNDGGNVMLFITRDFTADTNMELYNKMLEIQHNPKYASYFAPVAAATTDATMMMGGE